MKIYTKTGDDGTTGLFGGRRLPKHHVRIQAYGSVDELNAMLGVVRSENSDTQVDRVLEMLQHHCFVVGADLATPEDQQTAIARIKEKDIQDLEETIDMLHVTLSPLHTFILPGGTRVASLLHLSRTVCRRAERSVALLCAQEEDCSLVMKYLNRLSDLLFVLARYTNHLAGQADIPWDKTK